MSSLQEVVVTPNPALSSARNYPTFDEDDDGSEFDEGDRALLSNSQSSPRWMEKAPESAWFTAKSTALEVRHSRDVHQYCEGLTCGIDVTYLAVHYSWNDAYRGASRPCLGACSVFGSLIA